MPETTPLIKAALNLRVGAGFDVYVKSMDSATILFFKCQRWDYSIAKSKKANIYSKNMFDF